MNSLFRVLNFINSHPLASQSRFHAFATFFRWQISQALAPCIREHMLTNRSKILVKKGLTGATGNIYTGLQEFQEMGFMLHFLRPEDTFADIGANVGSYTVLASGHVGARSLSFEPVPSTFKWLSDNIEINNINNLVDAFNLGLGSQPGVLRFTSGEDTVNHVISEKESCIEEKSVMVDVKTFDSFTADFGCPVLVKIDVEGFESEVLHGMRQTLSNPVLRGLIIELNGSGVRYGFSDESIHGLLIEQGFSPFSYNPLDRQLQPQEKFGTHNTIYLRDIDFCENRVRSADPVQVQRSLF